MRGLWSGIGVLGVAVALAGCASAPAWQQPYGLGGAGIPGQTAPAAMASGRQVVLRVAPVQAPVWLDSTRMQYWQQGEHARRVYPHVRWEGAPAQMLGPILVNALHREGGWRAVLQGGESGQAQTLLQVQLQDFGVEYQGALQGTAVLRVTATLSANPDFRILAQREFVVRLPLPHPGPTDEAAALGSAAHQVSAEIAHWAATTRS